MRAERWGASGTLELTVNTDELQMQLSPHVGLPCCYDFA